MSKKSLTVIMLTLNEDYHLADAIENVEDIAEQIFIVDSLSSDTTVDIALEKGVHIVQRRFTNFGDQWNFALDNCPFQTEWTLKLDPDERLTEELKNDIRNVIDSKSSLDAYEFKRRLWFMGKPLHVYSNVLRLWKTGTCRFSEVLVNEHPIIEGKLGFLKGKMEHLDSKNLHHWHEKQNKYTTMEAITLYENRSLAANPNLFGNPLERRMFFKKLFFKLPFKYTFFFIYHLFIDGAWKDGIIGWNWSLLRNHVHKMIELKYIEMKTNNTVINMEVDSKELIFDKRVKSYK